MTVQYSRKFFSNLGLALVLVLNSCATVPRVLNQPKRPKQTVEAQTKSVVDLTKGISSQQIRKKLDQFKIALNKGDLNASDWKLHDELLESYIQLKQTTSNKLVIPANSRIILPFETYCLNAGRAPPSEHEVYHWQKSKPGIKYYTELLALRRSGEIKQSELQELLWNLGNETRWDDYPDRLKAILQRVDPKASLKLPSQIKDQAKSLITDSIISLPGVSEALVTYNLVKGKYYTYEDFKKSVESLTSKHELSRYDDLTQIPETEVYSQSESEGYSNQNVTFYNPTNQAQELDLTEYYLAPERNDVQRIGINPTAKDPTLLSDLEKTLYETMARLGIGFTPILGDVADIYEMIYGKDFLNGKSLSFDERLASAVGVVLGSGSTYRHAKRWVNAPAEYLPKFESGFAKVANKNSGLPTYTEAEKILNDSHVKAKALGKGLDYKGTQELSKFLRDKSAHRADRIETIRSFEPGSIRRQIAQHDETVYRWHNDDTDVQQFGRFLSPDMIEDRAMARSQLALPDRNSMKHLDSFTLKGGSTIFEGRIAPYASHPGGARQILIPGNIKNDLKFQGRIK